MPTTQNIVIDLNTRGTNPVAFTHQGDTARSFVFEVYNDGEAFTLTGYTAKIGAMLPADLGYYVIAGDDMATGAISGNKITVTLPAAYTAKSGNGVLTIIITGSSETIRPINVDFRIQKSADAADTVAGASDFPASLAQIVDDWITNNSADTVTQWLEDALDVQSLEEVIDAWLTAHPEATTTIIDGSVTYDKLSNELKAGLEKTHPECKIFAPYKGGEQGDCTVIKCADELILVDFGAEESADTVASYLVNNGLTTFTRCIITHFHPDHVGGYQTILSNAVLDFSNCAFYVPPSLDYTKCTGVSSYETMESTVIDYIENLGNTIVTPTDNTETDFGGVLSCRWLNVDTVAWDSAGYYNEFTNSSNQESTSTNMNNFSMVCEFTHGNITMLFSADIEPLAQSVVAPFLNRVDVYKMEHHGVNEWVNSSYMAKINPKIAFVEGVGYIGHFPKNPMSKHLQTINAAVMVEAVGSENTVIISNGFEVAFSDGGNNAVNFAFPYMNTITDPDTLTENGVYRLNGVTVENVQLTPVYGFLFNAFQSTFGTQFLLTQAGYVAARGYRSGAWTPWARLTDHQLNIPSNSDLDDYTALGHYHSSSKAVTQTLTNCPVSETGFDLNVRAGASDAWIIQEITQATTGYCNLYYRAIRVDGTESIGPWYQIPGTVLT